MMCMDHPDNKCVKELKLSNGLKKIKPNLLLKRIGFWVIKNAEAVEKRYQEA